MCFAYMFYLRRPRSCFETLSPGGDGDVGACGVGVGGVGVGGGWWW